MVWHMLEKPNSREREGKPMNKKILRLVSIISLLLFKTQLFGMEASATAHAAEKKTVIFVVSGQWEGSKEFAEKSDFYKKLDTVVRKKNTAEEKEVMLLVPFVCKQKFTDLVDAKKIDAAALLSQEILMQKRDGGTHFVIFAQGDGADITALATQLLNTGNSELSVKARISRSQGRGIIEKLEALKDRMNLTRLAVHKMHVAASGGTSKAFSLDANALQKLITVIIISPNEESPYLKFFEHDSELVDVVHEITPGNPTESTKTGQEQTHFINTRSNKLKACLNGFVACLHSPKTKAIVLVSLKIAIPIIIALL